MISAEQLRIGNWYDEYGEHKKVTPHVIECLFESSERFWVEPIPLTPEILEKCGFEKDGFYNSSQRWVLLNIILFEGNGHFILCHYPTTKIKYLHQLQNLYFALTGEELIYKP